MHQRIVLIGAGSAQFGFGTLSDIFASKVLEGSEIVLHDINPQALKRTLDAAQAHVEAHALPFEPESFDAVISIDAWHYFAADSAFLSTHLLPMLRPGGLLAVGVPGLRHAFGAVQDVVPDRAAGIASIATAFGAARTVRIALVAWIVASMSRPMPPPK